MGATACAMMALLRPGDHLVSSAWIYGGSHALFARELAQLGIETTFVDPAHSRGWRLALRPNTRALFVESPVNPTTRVLDLRPLSALTREAGVALVVDSTFASAVNFRPLEHGADVVIQSATKYLNGHHDVLGGAVMGTAAFVEEVRQKMMLWGQVPDPFACWLLERGLKTLGVRVERQNASALAVARWAEGHPAVARVHYPGLPSHPDHALAPRSSTATAGCWHRARRRPRRGRPLPARAARRHARHVVRRRRHARRRAALHVARRADGRGARRARHPRRVRARVGRRGGRGRPDRGPRAGARGLTRARPAPCCASRTSPRSTRAGAGRRAPRSTA
jgi:O-acetylhomoserine/O-acetylserine sulfhydrylase-like pyridoxal-dependent enzyme